MHVHFTNIQGDSTLEECVDGSCGGGDGGSGAAYWNVFVVSSHPGYSTFHAPQSSTYSRLHDARHVPLTIHQYGGLEHVLASTRHLL